MRLTVAGEFGEENFSDFLTAIIKDRKLVELDTWKEACKYFRDNKECVEGLTVAGEFGEENFSDFLTAIIKDRKLVELDTWKEACKYFRDNKECVEATTPATIKRTVPVDVDMDEYAFMLENADKSEPFRNKLSRRIDPSLVIPAVRVKEVEPEIVIWMNTHLCLKMLINQSHLETSYQEE